MTLETAEALEDLTMSTDGTAYIVTTIALLGGVLAFYYFYIYNNPEEEEEQEPEEEKYTPLEAQDFTLEELRPYDGTDGKPVCISVNHIVYDVTKGKNFYGQGGPYAMLAGKDGSRALAKMSLDASDVKDEWDDLEDLTPFQRDSLLEWEMKFQTRYTELGKLLKTREGSEE
ncbi:uncharacterized protein LOC134818057 isoform X2 [Bolinopsis microptera]|uniref:uncharacterized protein LOC134818057 isoform X2 n=1 Tax=Bolinopsis microptera TaxID=2820187 RepID=UPI0030796E01